MEHVKRYILEQVSEHKIPRDKAKLLLLELGDCKEGNVARDDIAIIGLNCRFPKASNADEFWLNLMNGRNCIDIPSESRRNIVVKTLEKMLGQEITNDMLELGGYMDDIDKFDASFFGIRKKEARFMDPWQRILLEVSYLALEDAGIPYEQVNGSNTVVYIGRDGSCESSYGSLSNDNNPYALNGSYASVLASRISHNFNLTGSSMVIDTACSSAMVAVHYACAALHSGQCDLALAGGINVKENIVNGNANPMSRILTGDNVVKTFDGDANGTLLSEGAGIFVCKRMKDAIRDNDQIYAVIKGSAVNNDGATKMVSAPNVKTEEEVILKAWEDARIEPETISYIEAHGTGTLLGDSIEINAIKNAFTKYTGKKQFCALGAVKTNIGHTVAASGMASMTKAVLSLMNKKIPGNINFEKVNPYINFPDSPVYVTDCITEWDSQETPRRCGVNSFGFSGTNGHIVLEEAKEVVKTRKTTKQYRIFAISAKSGKSLFMLLKQYKYLLSEKKHTINFADLCYSAACCRNHFEERIAFIANGLEELKRLISKMIEKFPFEDGDEIFYGRHQKKKDYGEAFYLNNPSREECKEIARLYVEGTRIGWREVFTEPDLLKIRLPLYPLERISHWHDVDKIQGKGNLPNNMEEVAATLVSDVTIVGRSNQAYSDTEKYVATLWGSVLKLETIHVEDNFYLIGGDSLKALNIVNQINLEKQNNVEVTELLQYPSLEEFSTYLNDNHPLSQQDKKLLSNIHLVEKREYYEVSAAQKRMYLLQQFDTKSVVYNMPKAIIVEGEFDLKKCKSIFPKLIKKHETLRTSFHMIHGKLMQKIHEDVLFNLIEIKEDGSDVETKTKNFIKAFELNQAPLIRVGLSTMGPQKTLLLFDVHHIVSDGTSMDYFVKEFMELYNGGELLPLKVQYKDFAAWQNEMLASGRFEQQKRYWMEKFHGDVPVLEFPVTSTKQGLPFEGKKFMFQTSKQLLDDLNKVCKETETTLFMVLLSAFTVLLYKYTGRKDVTIGIPIAGRRHSDVYGIIGMFINTLPFRAQIQSDSSFRDHLIKIKQAALEAYQNQDYPFDELVEALQLGSREEDNPLFNVMFNLQDKNMEWKELNGLKFEHLDIDSSVSKFDLTLNALNVLDGVSFEFEYSTRIFSDNFIMKMAGHYNHLLEQIVKEKDKKIKEYHMMNFQEEMKVLQTFNNTKKEYNLEQDFCDLFLTQVKRTPDSHAILYKDKAYTYKELDAASDQKAKVLKSHMVSQGDVVAIMSHCSFHMLAGMLAIWKVGGIYLPVDPEHPRERIEFMIQDGKPKIIMTEEEYLPLTDFTKSSPTSLDGTKTAYIMYTSGSTGLPKAVMGTWKGMMNRLNWIWDVYPFAESEVCCQKTSLNYIDSIFEITSPLLKGIPLVVVTNAELKDPAVFIHKIKQYKITRITLVPSFLKILLEAVEALHVKLPDLEMVVSSGEALNASIVERFQVNFPDCKLFNFYGPTEASCDVVYHETQQVDVSTGVIPIGRPISNTQIFIMDADGNPVPIGVWGELHIGGEGLAKGYFQRVDLTNERFALVSIRGIGKERLYKTGDLCRYRDDGVIEYSGRIDNQIKIAGHRIEAQEVEAAITSYPDVKETIVMACKEDSLANQLVAYVVLNKDHSFSKKMIMDYLQNKLPAYMIPAIYIECDEFPLLTSGKIDRNRLPKPELQERSDNISYVPPDTELEEELADIWRTIMNVGEIGVLDSFFHVGGNSLMAMQIIIRIKEEMDLEVSLKEFLDNRTIRSLAIILEDKIIEGSNEDEITEILTDMGI